MILKICIVGYIALGALLSVAMVGKPRKPTTPGVAAGVVLICSLEILAVLYWWPR